MPKLRQLESPPALLVLEDGRTFHGRAFGAVGETFGEAVFATGMSGYQETLTDPSYYRQVVVATAPHIGNTGWNDEDDESGRIWVAGYVVRDAARIPSNWRSRRSLMDELRAQGIVGMCDVDTRALTRHIRERGAMRVGVSSIETERGGSAGPGAGAAVDGRRAPRRRGQHRRAIRRAGRRVNQLFRVVAVDLGIKSMTPVRMAERGIEVHVRSVDGDASPTSRRGTRTGSSSPTAPATRAAADGQVDGAAARCSPPASRTSASASATSCSAGHWASARTSWATGTAASTSR